MKTMKILLTAALALCLMLSLCACGGDADSQTTTAAQDTTTTGAAQDTTAAAAEDGKATYTVTVVDEAGNPISGAMVQICKDTCLPGSTNAQGVATFSVLETDGYKISFMALPAGYDYSSEAQEFYFDGDAKELTITLKAVA